MEKKIETSFKCPRCGGKIIIKSPTLDSFGVIRCPHCNLRMSIYFYSLDSLLVTYDLGLDPLKTEYKTGFIKGIPLGARI